jgi:hypothetical protein
MMKDDQQAQGRTRKALLWEENERPHEVIVSLQQEVVRYLEPEVSYRLLKMIEEHAAASIDEWR